MQPWKNVKALVLLLLSGTVLSCGGGSGSGGSGEGQGAGTLSLSLTDGASYGYEGIYVTIDEVLVHNDRGGGWHTVATPGKTFNLLELVNGVREDIGLAELPAGHYTQMRLIIGNSPDGGINAASLSHPYANYLVKGDEAAHELKVPSGQQTGLKIVGGFDINESETTELILDFDACKSVVMAGASGKWHLKPTVKVLAAEEHSRVFGTVADEDGGALANALVSAQAFDPSAELLVETSTLSGDEGDYALFLRPAAYNLVAYSEGYMPACRRVEALSGSVLERDFGLETALEIGVAGVTVAIGSCAGAVESTDSRHVTLSFRRSVSCGEVAGEEWIEVTSVNLGNGGSLDVGLPAGSYDVVATTAGELAQLFEGVDVAAGFETSVHACFPSE